MHKNRRLLSKQLVWLYGSKSNQGFFSHIGAGCQRLPNGNTLVCSDTEGHFFEVTPECELVWEYINPVTKEFGVLKTVSDMIPMANSVFRCYRYSPGHPALKYKTLTPKGLLTDVVTRPASRNPADEKFPQPGDAPSAPDSPTPMDRRRSIGNEQSRALSRQRSSGGGNRFERMDSDRDGKISYDEIYAYEKEKKGDRFNDQQVQRKFGEIDTDGNGTISKAEMEKAPKGRGGRK